LFRTRKENYCGQPNVNLVVPTIRRLAVLKLGHDGSHFREVRTFERNIGSGLTWGSGHGEKSVRAVSADYASTCSAYQA
jgi:hypothetical protein